MQLNKERAELSGALAGLLEVWRTLAAYAGALDMDEVPSLEEVVADLGLSTPSAGDLTYTLSSPLSSDSLS